MRRMGGAEGIELGGRTIYRLAYVNDVDIMGEVLDEVRGKALSSRCQQGWQESGPMR